jgi:signal transduction histidine kinase
MDSGDFQLLRLAVHELRTPLTSIQLNAQLMARSLATSGLEKECRLTGTIISAARKLDGLTRELGEVVRLMSGEVALDLRACDLTQLLPEILARSGRAPDDNPIRVAVPPGPFPITADARCLERILTNLILIGQRLVARGSGIDLRVSANECDVEFSVVAPVQESGGTLALPSDEKFGLGFFLARILVECHRGKLETQWGSATELVLRFSLPRQPSAGRA